MSNNYKTYILVFLTILFGSYACQSLNETSVPTVDEIMEDFYHAEGRAEDMLMDPLIIHVEIVKQRVIQEIQDPTMDKRRYAILFLGNERIKEALPVLRKILNNQEEKDYFRGDALESIYRIDSAEGIQRAKEFINQKDYLGNLSREIVNGTFVPFYRTRQQALSGYHE